MFPGESNGGQNEGGIPLRLGYYELEREIGRGGMGVVFEARHRVLGTTYALKILDAQLSQAEVARERFEREARVMAKLRHPGILQVDDFGADAGRFFLRMPLLRGIPTRQGRAVSLDDWIQQEGVPVAPLQVAEWMRQILEALAYAHGLGVVHRDLKPSNLLMAEGGLRISDFGLVSLVETDWVLTRARLSMSRTRFTGETPGRDAESRSDASILGTFEYMAPEQREGKPATMASDLYAVGLIAFRLLTGQRMPGLRPPSQLVPNLSPAWDEWLRRLLEAEPEKRWARAEDALAALPKVLPAPPVGEPAAETEKPAPLAPAKPEPRPRQGIAVAIAAIGTLVVAIGLGWFVLQTGQEPKVSPVVGSAGALDAPETVAPAVDPVTSEQGAVVAEFGPSLDGQVAEPASPAAEMATEVVPGSLEADLLAAAEASVEAVLPPPEPALATLADRAGEVVLDLGAGVSLTVVWLADLGLWMGRDEITNAQFRRFWSAHDSGAHRGRSLNENAQPVVNVTVLQAAEFAAWIGQEHIHGSAWQVRLPTAAEWRRAASQGQSGTYLWGGATAQPPAGVNLAGVESRAAGVTDPLVGWEDAFAVSAPVEQTGTSTWGLRGLVGNVAEWVAIEGGRPVALGGSWLTDSTSLLLLSANSQYLTSTRSPTIGFRLVVVPR